MFASAKLAKRQVRVKPEQAMAARNQDRRIDNKQARAMRRGKLKRIDLNDSNRPVRTRMPGGVAGAQSTMTAPYADALVGLILLQVPMSFGYGTGCLGQFSSSMQLNTRLPLGHQGVLFHLNLTDF